MAAPNITTLRRSPNHNRHGEQALTRGTLDKRLVIVCVRGNVSIKEIMKLLLQRVVAPANPLPVLVLGPTAPEEIWAEHSERTVWVTFVDGSASARPVLDVEVISPDNLLDLSLFIEKAAEGEGEHLIMGDFLDNIIKMSTRSPESFYSFLCQLTSRIRIKKRTAILIIKEDIHDRPVVEMVKRFADVVLELRDQDNNGALTVEMRTLNFADNIYTRWMPFPEGLRPFSATS